MVHIEKRKIERNKDFYNVCEKVRCQFNGYVSVENITRIAVYREARKFYISEEECAIIISDIRNNRIKSKHKVKSVMYYDIRKLYYKIRKRHPNITNTKASELIVNSKAPRFYITENSAKKLYYKILKE